MLRLIKSEGTIHPAKVIIPIAFLTSMFAALFLIIFNFDGIHFNGDSYVYFRNAKHFSESIFNQVPPKPAYWPYGFPALLSTAFVLGDVSFESARWVNVIFGGMLSYTLCSLLIFISRIKKLSNSHFILIVLAAGIFPFGHGYFLKYQITIMSDIMAAFLYCLIILFCWQWRNLREFKYLIFAGVAFGLSLSTRYVSVLMLIPALTIILCDVNYKSKNSIKNVFLSIVLFGGTALLIFSPQFYITIQNTASSFGNGLLNSWDIKNFFSLEHESNDGHQIAKIPSVIYYFSQPFQWHCFTPFAIPLSGLGLKYATRELPRWLWASLIIWFLVFYVFLCGIPLQNGRIGFSLALPVVVWLSLGLLECLIQWKKYFKIILMIVSLVWVISLILSFKSMKELVNEKEDLRTTAKLLAKSLPPHSTVISTSLCAVYWAYPSNIKPLSIYMIKEDEVRKMLASNTKVFLAIDENRFIPQWSNYPAGKCYKFIKNSYSCNLKFSIDGFEVYEVRPYSLKEKY